MYYRNGHKAALRQQQEEESENVLYRWRKSTDVIKLRQAMVVLWHKGTSEHCLNDIEKSSKVIKSEEY